MAKYIFGNFIWTRQLLFIIFKYEKQMIIHFNKTVLVLNFLLPVVAFTRTDIMSNVVGL